MDMSLLCASFLLVGAVLVAMALAEPWVRRLPLSPALIYLIVGWVMATVAVPPLPGLDLAHKHAGLVRVLSELAVLLSLFAIGLKIRIPANWQAWRAPVLLATSGVVWTWLLGGALAWLLLPLSLPMALLLAAILAPTDPVLASDVQVHDASDRDALRMSLTVEGALNDGTAAPLVLLSLGFLGLHELGDHALRWALVDTAWSLCGGVALGAACGRGIGHLMLRRVRSGSSTEWDELLYLGTIGLTSGLAQWLEVSGFLAVFAAGATLLRHHPAASPAPEAEPLGHQLRAFGARCERLVEVLMVLLIGAAMTRVQWSLGVLLFALAMLVVVRPVSVVLGLLPRPLPRGQRGLVAWFGIRGVGSLLYLAMALQMGVKGEAAERLVSATLACIALSIGVHGVSATPLMGSYQRRREQWDRRRDRRLQMGRAVPASPLDVEEDPGRLPPR